MTGPVKVGAEGRSEAGAKKVTGHKHTAATRIQSLSPEQSVKYKWRQPLPVPVEKCGSSLNQGVGKYVGPH